MSPPFNPTGFAPDPPDRRLDPNQALQRAAILHQQGDLGGAERLYRVVLKADRNHFDTLYRLGLVLGQQGRLEEGLRHIQRALYQRPNAAAAHASLATFLLALNRREEAVAHYRKALVVEPGYVAADANRAAALHLSLGSALLAVGRAAEALTHLERAAALQPGSAEAQSNLGAALVALDRYDQAQPRFEAALKLQPEHAPAHHGLGIVLGVRGEIEPACEAYRRAIASAPATPIHYLGLVNSTRIATGDPCVAAMEALAADTARLPEEARVHLHFALAKAYDDLGQEPRAVPHLLAGNSLKRRQVAYEEAGELGALERIESVFTPSLLAEKAGSGDPGEEPVFVVGLPRGGSTLIEQILASHPQVFGAGELTDFEAAVSNVAGGNAAQTFPDAIPTLSPAQIGRIGEEYRRRVRANPPGAARVVDKMPPNYRFAGLIHLALPNARIIHAVRDPVDTCLSCFQQLFVANIPFAYDLDELGRHYRAYRRLMRHWQAVLPPRVILDVHYEAVVADLETEARRIIAHCGLDWDDACLAFHRTQRVIKTASSAQVRRPIYTSSVGRARAYPDLAARLSAALAD